MLAHYIGESETTFMQAPCESDSHKKCNGFYLGPCHLSTKFYENNFVKHKTYKPTNNKHTNQQTDTGENTTSLAEYSLLLPGKICGSSDAFCGRK